MERWENHWFGPVAAIRPYLFQRALLLVVACDLIVLMIERGGRYGLDSIPFNVAHFGWIDKLHGQFLPMGVPTATYYVCVVSLTSFLSFCLAFGGHRAWLQAVVTLLYTYAWTMSRLDSYLHHYMLSILLGLMVFFPRIEAEALRDAWLDELMPNRRRAESAGSVLRWRAIFLLALACGYRIALSDAFGLTETQKWIGMFSFFGVLVLALIRWQPQHWDRTGPLVSAWAYRLLATTVGVIYIFTSIAKMDAEWCGGFTLRQVGTTEDVLAPVAQFATRLGTGTDTFWSLLATLVIPLELSLAVCYLLAPLQDESGRRWIQRLCMGGWLLAIGLHLNNEMMNLVIQWFGYYMLLLATIILLPARFLTMVGVFFIWPECWLNAAYRKYLYRETKSKRYLVQLAFVALMTLLALRVFGYLSGIGGCIVASWLLTSGIGVAIFIGMLMSSREASMRLLTITAVAACAMSIVIIQCSARFDYYDIRGKTLQLLGKDAEAIAEMNRAERMPAPSDKATGELMTNLGVSYRRTGDAIQAESCYRKAIKADPRQFLAHYSLGNLLVPQQRLDEAATLYRDAIAIKPDLSDAYVNLGNVLEFQNRIPDAIACYQAALKIEPNAEDIRQMLESARKRRKDGSDTEP